MRIRTIKPDFWSDEKLAKLPPIDRLVFIGLWSLADDEGRLIEGHGKAIDGTLFPETDDSAMMSIERLARLRRIIRYKAENGQRLIQIVNWKKHQRVDNPSKSKYPPPTAQDIDSASDTTALATVSREPGEVLALGSRKLEVEVGSGPKSDAREDSREPRENGATPAPPDPAITTFAEAWTIYPKRAGTNSRADALRVWIETVRRGVDPEAMRAGVERYARFCEATGKVGTETVMQAQRFFGRGRHWEQAWDLPVAPPEKRPVDFKTAREDVEREAGERTRRWGIIQAYRATAEEGDSWWEAVQTRHSAAERLNGAKVDIVGFAWALLPDTQRV